MPRPASVSRCTRSGKLVALGWAGDSENTGVCNETHRRKRASGNDTRSAKKHSERDCFRLVRYPGEGVLSVGEISYVAGRFVFVAGGESASECDWAS
jgi:hypothetical protein